MFQPFFVFPFLFWIIQWNIICFYRLQPFMVYTFFLYVCVCVCLCVSEYVFGEIKIYQIREYWLRPHTNWYIWVPHTHTHTSFFSLSLVFALFSSWSFSFFFLFDCYKRRQIISTNYFSIFGLMKSTHKQTNHTGNKPSMLLFDHLI